MFCKNRVSANNPDWTSLKLSLMNMNVFFSLPTPKVTSAGSTRTNGPIFNKLTQSKINLMMVAAPAPNFFNSFKSCALMEFAALSASSKKGCALAKSSSASAFSPAIRSASA